MKVIDAPPPPVQVSERDTRSRAQARHITSLSISCHHPQSWQVLSFFRVLMSVILAPSVTLTNPSLAV
jgi:hypothetical protein